MKVKWRVAKYGDLYSEFVVCILPIQVHTHREHTPGAVGSLLCCGARGAVGGSVPCSRVSLQSWYWGWRERWLFTTKSKWLDNRHCLGFWGIKKGVHVYHCRVVVATAKIHLYANEAILHSMSPLKFQYCNLNSSDEGFRKFNPAYCTCLKMINSWKH